MNSLKWTKHKVRFLSHNSETLNKVVSWHNLQIWLRSLTASSSVFPLRWKYPQRLLSLMAGGASAVAVLSARRMQSRDCLKRPRSELPRIWERTENSFLDVAFPLLQRSRLSSGFCFLNFFKTCVSVCGLF